MERQHPTGSSFTGAVRFNQIRKRLANRSMVDTSGALTSNQSFGAWGEVFGARVIVTAILDWVLHHAVTVNIRGNSYRLKDKLNAGFEPPRYSRGLQSLRGSEHEHIE